MPRSPRPRPLADYGRRTADALTRAALDIPVSDGVIVRSDALGRTVAAREATLSTALGAVETEARELKAAIGARDLAIEPWARAYRGVALTLSGLFTLAGRDDLAARVRPTERRARGEDESDEPTPAEPVTPSGPVA